MLVRHRRHRVAFAEFLHERLAGGRERDPFVADIDQARILQRGHDERKDRFFPLERIEDEQIFVFGRGHGDAFAAETWGDARDPAVKAG